MNRIHDMTSGNPVKLILMFAFPLILTNLGQQFYMIVDTIIVGRAVGVQALASLGATDWVYWMFLWTIFALTQGFSILITQNFGAKDYEKLRKSITMSIFLCAIIAIGLTVAGLLFAKPLLQLLRTPQNIFDGALSYLTVMLIGIPIVVMFNMSAGILRSFGDGKSPLIAMIVAAVSNIGLDLLFVIVFGWGIIGAAAASVIAQLISFLYCFYIIKKMPVLKMEKKDWKIEISVIKRLCYLGFPIAIQYLFIMVGGAFIQFAVNKYGFVFVAGYTAANKMYVLMESVSTAIGFSSSTYMAQNWGAKRIDRIEKGMKSAALLAVLLSAVVSVIFIIFGRPFLGLFVSAAEANATEAMDIGFRYLFVMCIFLSLLYLLHTYRASLQGLGNSITPMLAGMSGFAVRVFVALVLPLMAGANGVYFAEPLGWLGGLVIIVPAFYKKVRKAKKEQQWNIETNGS